MKYSNSSASFCQMLPSVCCPNSAIKRPGTDELFDYYSSREYVLDVHMPRERPDVTPGHYRREERVHGINGLGR